MKKNLCKLIGIALWTIVATTITYTVKADDETVKTSAEDSTKALIKKVIDAVMLAKIQPTQGPISTAVKRIVEQHIVPEVDTEVIAKRIAGKKAWKGATPKVRQALQNTVNQWIVKTYATVLMEYKGEPIEIKREETKQRDMVVRVQLTLHGASRKQIIALTMRTRDDAASWKINDLILDGISTVRLQRDNMRATIAKVGLEEAIRRWKAATEHTSESGTAGPGIGSAIIKMMD